MIPRATDSQDGNNLLRALLLQFSGEICREQRLMSGEKVFDILR
jgi:hypothetical protein